MTARQLHRVQPVAPNRRDRDDAPTIAAWMDNAPCQRAGDLFFSDDKKDIARAKRICTRECSIGSRISCMDYAFDNSLEYGVWGGTARDERVEKTCVDCERTKTLSEFPRRPTSTDGYGVKCSVCITEIYRQATTAEHVEASVARFAPITARQGVERDKRLRRYAELLEEKGRDEAVRVLQITKRTAQRYDARLREQQEVAA